MPNPEHLGGDDELQNGVRQSQLLDSQLSVPNSLPKEGMIGENSTEQVTGELSASTVLRSRLCPNKNILPRKEDVKNDDITAVQQSNFTNSLPSEEELTRLKTACHLASSKFLEQQQKIKTINENRSFTSTGLASSKSQVKKKGTLAETSSSPSNLHSSTITSNMFPLVPAPATLLVFLKLILFGFTLAFIFYCLMVFHKPTQLFVSRHTQDWIYPFMRTVRFASLPFIKRYPQFHEVYEDACLLPNPFFEMNDVSCWPCEHVRHVIDLTGFSNFTNGYYHSGIPFIVKDGFKKEVKLQDLVRLYRKEEKLAGSVLLQSSSQSEVTTFADLFRHNNRNGRGSTGDMHFTWKINSARYARLMRQHFKRPYFIPNTTEVSVQQFLFADEPLAEQYAFPVTEFANVFVMQAEGRRMIVLVPVKHCRSQCKVISIVLQPTEVLFYNWLFWRPTSFPMKDDQPNELSVTYVGSFY